MKKFIISLFVFGTFSTAAVSQITVQGSIRKGATPNVLEILAKPTEDIYAQVGNINITFSIPDRTSGGGNPADASIIKSSPLPNVIFIPTDENNPYIIGSRAYYSYLILPNTPDDVASLFRKNTDNIIGSFTFPANYDPGIRLEDLSSTGGGPNFQMMWYVQFSQGIGDVTNYTTPFYTYCPVINASNNSDTSGLLVTLPVTFLDFSAAKQGNHTALITWDVENEGPNTVSYEIQKSLNGVDFSLLNKISPLNNGRTSNSYSYTEDDLYSIRKSGVIYFRIKQTDRDGKFVYTPTRSLRVNSTGLLVSSYPNPVKSNAYVVVDLPETAEIAVRLVDGSGKLVYANQTKGAKGANFSTINMAKMAVGTYTLNVQAGKEMKTMVIVKAE